MVVVEDTHVGYLLKAHPSEKKIQSDILFYLDHHHKGFACKIELGAVPIKNKSGQTIGIRPFGNAYYRRFMSDILFIDRTGRAFFIEVKSPGVMRSLSRRYYGDRSAWNKFLAKTENKVVSGQFHFLLDAASRGISGGFAAKLEDVEEILKSKPGTVCFPEVT